MVTSSITDQGLAIGTSARILYVNGDGRTSERTIDIIRRYTSRDGVTYLRAWCHLRGEERTFRTDRVLAVLESSAPAASPAPAVHLRPAPTLQPARVVTPPPAPEPAPKSVEVRHAEYRGQRIEVRRSSGPVTGGADTDQDGEVTWEEVQRFQTALDRDYRYKTNPTALRPDEFMAAGGGDCEDWALMTAGMLRFWGIPVFIGSLASSTGHHAVALVPTTHIPPGAMTIDIPAGGSLRAGCCGPPATETRALLWEKIDQ